MYRTCLFCNSDLGDNRYIPTFPVGQRLAFDAKKGRLWVVCTQCGRWNLSPLEERWEATEECERLFRGTRLRMSTDNIGLARLRWGFELVRIGPALLPEIASWRYGARLERWRPRSDEGDAPHNIVWRGSRYLAHRAASALARYAIVVGLSDEALLKVRTFRRGQRVLARSLDELGMRVVIRYGHLAAAELVRPDRGEPWRIRVRHDDGTSTLAEGPGLRAAGKMLAVLNFGVAASGEVRHAIAKLDDAGDPEGYFARVASLAMRTSWGRFPDAPDEGRIAPEGRTFAERLAVQLANRSFWGRGGTGSEELTPLYHLPAVDRLALEMAANEDLERRALAGELASLRDAWKEAEEIAAIADGVLSPDGLLEEFKRQYYLRMGME